MANQNHKRGVFIPPERKPWDHELRVARFLALAGHYVEFLPEGNLHSPDILLDGIEYEIKSPESAKAITIERALKKALKQSHNLIIDASRMEDGRDDNIKRYLTSQVKVRKQIKRMLFITKTGKIIDIFKLI